MLDTLEGLTNTWLGGFAMSERTRRPAWERFWEKVDKTETCWNWTAGLNDGYGRFMLRTQPRNEPWLAHRLAYTWLIGPIPEGLHLDHLCRNTLCVNPAHLQPVTSRENTFRSPTHDEWQRTKTHCPEGHPYSGNNLYVYDKRRACVTCRRAASRRNYLRRKAAKTAA